MCFVIVLQQGRSPRLGWFLACHERQRCRNFQRAASGGNEVKTCEAFRVLYVVETCCKGMSGAADDIHAACRPKFGGRWDFRALPSTSAQWRRNFMRMLLTRAHENLGRYRGASCFRICRDVRVAISFGDLGLNFWCVVYLACYASCVILATTPQDDGDRGGRRGPARCNNQHREHCCLRGTGAAGLPPV